ncbi:MAG: N-acetylneuraminate synthase family protein [Magnetococcales bacterium]|nr:N-acetylneuraminate synthase family protein [Magnetococcales bacterium]
MSETPACTVIAEAGLNHNGSLEIAKQLVDVAAEAGVDVVKFQKRQVDVLAVESLLDAPDARFPGLGRTYREIRETLEFSKEEYLEIRDHCRARGVDFMCTAFDVESVEFLEEIGLETYKLASHSLTNLPLLTHLAGKKKPVYLSTGMCLLEEIDQAVEVLRQGVEKLVLLHCVSAYPQPAEVSNLRMIDVLRNRYGLPVGYSGHEIGFLPTLAAVARGAVAVERHFTLDKAMEGFDHKISLDPSELKAMVRDIRTIETTLGTGEKQISAIEWITRHKYHVSMVSRQSIPQGTLITPEMVTYKNPGTGILPKDAQRIIGKVAARDIARDVLLELGMIR